MSSRIFETIREKWCWHVGNPEAHAGDMMHEKKPEAENLVKWSL
jgi:hypothetical protein